MDVVWTADAYRDRDAVWQYLFAENPQAAADMDDRFAEAADLIGTQPMMGKEGQIEGTREWLPHKSYRRIYEIWENKVYILSSIHCSRLYPP